jgi:hypothetical protein
MIYIFKLKDYNFYTEIMKNSKKSIKKSLIKSGTRSNLIVTKHIMIKF